MPTSSIFATKNKITKVDACKNEYDRKQIPVLSVAQTPETVIIDYFSDKNGYRSDASRSGQNLSIMNEPSQTASSAPSSIQGVIAMIQLLFSNLEVELLDWEGVAWDVELRGVAKIVGEKLLEHDE